MASKCRVLKGGYCEITQYYGGNNNHLGIDIVGQNYTLDTVIAHSDGVVSLIQTGQVNNPGSTGNASYGNFIKIDHGDGYFTLYAHLDKVYVKLGDTVKKGAEIGYMGNTGNSYGAHTHFEVWKNNTRTNPLDYLDKDLFESITKPVERDESKNQLKVNVDDLRVRVAPSTSSEILGMAELNGIYNYFETKESEGYTWYRISDNEWIANKDNWCTIYSLKEDKTENGNDIDSLIAKINELNKKIALLEKENESLKNDDSDYKIFVSPKTDLYYLELKENEQLVYKKI